MRKMQKSILIKNQKKKVVILDKQLKEYGNVDLIINLRYDDDCGNGHNSFSITGELYKKSGSRLMCGCIHDIIKQLAPEYGKYIKYHMMSSDSPMHYIANTVYFAENGNLEAARNSAIAPDATLEQLKNKVWLNKRLPKLIEEFKNAMEELGFVF